MNTPDPSEAKTELPEDFGKPDALTEQFNTYVAKLERENQSLRKAAEAARVALSSMVDAAQKQNWQDKYPDRLANSEAALAELRAELSPDR